MFDRYSLKENFDPIRKTISYVKYKQEFARNHPDYFKPDGLLVFVGPQGSGKTLSAVNYVYNLMINYPKCILVTNLFLSDYPFDYERVFEFKDNDDFSRYSNGELGVIFLVDEIQLYLNSLQSKNINMDTMTQISQQRKQRKHIVCTSQVFGRLAKPLREQFSTVVLCSSYFNFLQKCQVIDRDSISTKDNDDSHLEGEVKMTSWYIHCPKYYNRYDTYYVIGQKDKFVSEEQKRGSIYASEYTVNC